MTLPSGTRLRVYEVTHLLGEAGMGQVYRARDTTLQRDIALKILPDSFAADADRLRRFEREAKTLAAPINDVLENDAPNPLIVVLH